MTDLLTTDGRPRCPVHQIPDCSPLLNGCSLPSQIAKIQRDAHRSGYEMARDDMVSGAFIGGPTYEALKASFSGQRIEVELRAKIAKDIRNEQVCGCVEDEPDYPDYWHERCRGAEYAARIAEEA